MDNLPRKKKGAYKDKIASIEEGVRVTGEQIMDPDCVMFLPCGTAARVTGTHYRREIVVTPDDSTEEFSGVVTLRPNIQEFLKINTVNGTAISVSGATFSGVDFPGSSFSNVPIVLDNWYFPAFNVLDSSGNKIGTSVMRQVERADCWAQDSVSGEWHRGYVSEVKSNCTASSNANYSNLVYGLSGATTAAACTVFVGQIDENGDFVYFASTANAYGTTSGVFADLAGVPGIATTYAIRATTDQEGLEYAVRARIGSIDLTNFDPIDYYLEPQTTDDQIYNTLKLHNTGVRMSAASLLCGFRGSDMNNAGLIGVARVPEGTPVPNGTPRDVYDWIATLPYDNYTGKVEEGGHTFWIPKTLRDIVFKRKTDPLGESNMLIIAFVVPGSTAGQSPSFSIVAKSTWEWIYASQSMPQFRAPPGWAFLEALYAVLGAYNPSGCNPSHMKKIKDIARKIASNPVIKELGHKALQLAVEGGKKALPALIAGMAL
jgi:hypothetical protein